MSMTNAPGQKHDLTRLETLRAFKEHLVRKGGVNVSPFAERVIRYDAKVEDYDVPEIHCEVRERIAQTIRGIHQGQPSRVIILAGDPGMGKSHLIGYFRSPQLAEELGYVLVCNSNHWKVSQFEECLLNWVLEALVGPSPNGPHLLLDKVQDIAFEALHQLLSQPGQVRRFEKASGFWQGLWRRLGHGHERLQRRLLARDLRVFRELHFPRFASYVCDRFLHNSGNPFHRYVLHVLLRYLFEDERELVLHWLRGKDVDFSASLGVKDRMEPGYKVIDAIKILVSLFTPEVSRNLGSAGSRAGRARVFFFAFDQMEGPNELFEKDDDWMKFFAQLSELYNTLPNVFILFTMTLSLRQRLYPQMEGQFRDRISRDPHYSLHRIEESEVLSLYRKRVARWLSEGPAEVREKWETLNEPYLPFDQEKVLQLSEQRMPIREKLEVFDREFVGYFLQLVTKPRIDFEGFRNDLCATERTVKANEYTANHLDQVKHLFDEGAEWFAADFGLSFSGSKWTATDQKLPALWLEFRDPNNPASWVRLFLVRFPWQYQHYVDGCLDLLRNLRIGRNFLWLVRAPKINHDLEHRRPDQVFARDLLPEVHTTVQALVHLLGNRGNYPQDEQEAVGQILREEIKTTYLGELLEQVREALTALQGGSTDAEDGANDA